jgi:hypothetical protein
MPVGKVDPRVLGMGAVCEVGDLERADIEKIDTGFGKIDARLGKVHARFGKALALDTGFLSTGIDTDGDRVMSAGITEGVDALL